jgi:hypothetical protein
MRMCIVRVCGIVAGAAGVVVSLVAGLILRSTVLISLAGPTGAWPDDRPSLLIIAISLLLGALVLRSAFGIRSWQLVASFVLCELMWLFILTMLTGFPLLSVIRNDHDIRNTICEWFTAQGWYPVVGWMGGTILSELYISLGPEKGTERARKA